MLAYIRGTLEEMSEDSVILDHQGMGYQIYMSALSVADIQMAVLSGDAKSLTKANGIGMKGAQRIIMELHDKIELESMLEPREDQSEAESAGAVTDEDITASVAMALVSLGYSQLEAMQAIRRVDVAQEMNTEELLKAALKKLI